jgi:hypothetical protein
VEIMGSKHDLTEFHFAKEVVSKFPLIEKELDETFVILYKYREFLAVQHVLDSISESKEMIRRQYKHYREVLEKKGKYE